MFNVFFATDHEKVWALNFSIQYLNPAESQRLEAGDQAKVLIDLWKKGLLDIHGHNIAPLLEKLRRQTLTRLTWQIQGRSKA